MDGHGPLAAFVQRDRQPFVPVGANRRLVWERVAIDPEKKKTDPRLVWLSGTTPDKHTAELVGAARQRRRAAVAVLERQGLATQTITVEIGWSDLAIGHSGGSVAAENSIALDRVLGMPFIPGSALKGAAKAAGAPEDASLFGDAADDGMGKIGEVVFLGGLPSADLRIGISVLTPHEQPYYEEPENNPPTGVAAPVPVPFPVVRSGTFEVTLVGRTGTPAAAVDRAVELLSTAVESSGLGAKTSAGYGYLTIRTTKS